MAFLVGFGSSPPPTKKNKNKKKKVVEIGPPVTKLSGSAHEMSLRTLIFLANGHIYDIHYLIDNFWRKIKGLLGMHIHEVGYISKNFDFQVFGLSCSCMCSD